MVTNLDASNYPSIRVPITPQNGLTYLGQLLFDRILCDVPCSGDGTIRKNMGIWKSWQPMDGNGLHGYVNANPSGIIIVANRLIFHSLQVRILQRAMNMLTADGRIVYSTCSLNPVENEAVIAEALVLTRGIFDLVLIRRMWLIFYRLLGFELVDVSSKLPELKRRPGLADWRPTTDRSGAKTYESYEEFMSSSVDEAVKGKMTEGHWPPRGVERLNLSRW